MKPLTQPLKSGLLATTCLLFASVVGNTAVIVPYFTDFTTSSTPYTYTSGTTIIGQDGWTEYDSSTATVTATDPTSSGHGQVLDIANQVSDPNTNRLGLTIPSPESQANMVIQYDSYFSALNTNGYTTTGVQIGDGTTEWWAVDIQTKPNNFTLNSGAIDIPGLTPTAGVWYTTTISLNWLGKTYDTTITDGVTTVNAYNTAFWYDGLGFPVAALNQLRFRSSFYAYTEPTASTYIDNLSIVPEPTSAFFIGFSGLALLWCRRIIAV